jgi:type II secretory pathway pseudopilin PulG
LPRAEGSSRPFQILLSISVFLLPSSFLYPVSHPMNAPLSLFLVSASAARSRRRRGSTLLLVMFVIAISATLIGAALTWSSNTNLVAYRASQLALANTAADSMLEVMFSRWRDVLRYNPNQERTDVNLSTTGVPIVQPNGSVTIKVTAPMDDDDLAAFTAAGISFGTPTLRHVTQMGDYDGINLPASGFEPLPKHPNPPSPGGYHQELNYKGTKPGYVGYIAYNVLYEVTASATITAARYPVTAYVKRYFTKVISPTFQNAVFFQDDLELHNSGTTIIDGLVHTNADMYACSFDPLGGGSATPSKLSFLGNVSYVGNFNGEDGKTYLSDAAQDRFGSTAKPVAPSWDGAGQINQLKQVDRMNVGGLDPSEFISDDTNYNNDSLRELIEIPYKKVPLAAADAAVNAPDPGTEDPPDIASQRLYNQAPLRIIINNGTMIVRDYQDHVITDATFLADLASAVPVAQRDRLLLDRREDESVTDAAAVKVSTLDVNLFNTAIKNAVTKGTIKYASASAPGGWNGTLYIADITGNDQPGQAAAAPAAKRGIMLVNGSKLPGATELPAGDPNRNFTVATQNGLYIKGDYNTGTTYDTVGNPYDSKGNPTAQPASNTDNSTPSVATEIPGYTSVPSAVMADAVTILSRKFTDAYTDTSIPASPVVHKEGDLDQSIQYQAGNPIRKAAPTTINTAIISGDVPSNFNSNGKPSGGAHNLTRFLENWDDPTSPGGTNKVKFTYNGSLVQLFVCQEFTGAWDTKNIYQNPQRLIRFDKRFLSTPPKSWPNTISYLRGKWIRNNPQ